MIEMAGKMLLGGVWGGRVDAFDLHVSMVQECWRRLAYLGLDPTVAPWHIISDECDPSLTLDTPERLIDAMDLASFGGRSGLYTFTTRDLTDFSKSFAPYMNLNVFINHPRGRANGPANTVQIRFEPGLGATGQVGWPASHILASGNQMVKDIVDVWHPESAYLCSSALICAAPSGPHPILGLVNWLSDTVVDPLELPRTHARERYAGGTLIGVDPDGPDPISDTKELASSIYDAKILKPLPIIQGQPDPA